MPKDGKNEDDSQAVRGLLEEANRMLKALKQGKAEEPEDKDVRLKKLQDQLDELKSMKVFRIAKVHAEGEDCGLLDSGATHAMRGKLKNESWKDMTEVKVTLACGREATLRMNQWGTMINDKAVTEPIVPLGKLVSKLNCKLEWDAEGLVVVHPERGRLPTFQRGGCPHVPRQVALEIIQEIEEAEGKMKMMKTKQDEERAWLRKMVEVHPALKGLPSEVQDALVRTPATDLTALPGVNRRRRRTIQAKGGVLHLYAGEDSGFTLAEAVKKCGGEVKTLVEVDCLRGKDHDMVQDEPYTAMLRMAFDGTLKGVVAGPNCRTRSVLRSYPISAQEHGPRPLRRWGGEEFGRKDLNASEKRKVYEDDVMMFRAILLYVIAVHVERTKDKKQKQQEDEDEAERVLLALEQPKAPEYMTQTVSFWWTDQWKALKEMYKLKEVSFNQGDWKGEDGGKGCVKPTTLGGNMRIDVPQERNPEAKGRSQEKVKDSKSLSRWVPGLMKEMAKEVTRRCQGREVTMMRMSWEEHVQHGHVPFHRDCKICQEAGAKSAPHRRLTAKRGQYPRAGVLSVDTSGPLIAGDDVGEEKMKFLLVGAYTWLAPKGSPLDDKQRDYPDEDEEDGIEKKVIDEEEDEADDEGNPREDPLDEGEEPEEGAKKEVEDPEEFEIKVFRMVTPLPSKYSGPVLQAVVDMILKLRTDGFEVAQVHSDNGGEFTSDAMQRWMSARGYIRTFTGVSDPQANGRAENAVQQVKSHIRRLLHQANWSSNKWPMAARHCDEQLRAARLGEKQKFPPLGAEVLVKKRKWQKKEFHPTMDRVTYIAPSWEGHGHWVEREDGTRIVTRFYLHKTWNPITDQSWLAVLEEMPDPVEVRRRLRAKGPAGARKLEAKEEDQDSQEDEEPQGGQRARILQIIMEEMTALMEDPDEAMLAITMRSVAQLRVLMEVGTSEEILQTRIIGMNEVLKDVEAWRKPIMEELISLTEDKEVLSTIPKAEVEEMFRKAYEEGRKLEVVPGKLVTTIKPAPEGGKKKARIVACGNFTAKDAQDELYAGRGDAVTLRILLKWAAEKQWSGVILDIKTAFLNTPWDDMDVLVKPPHLLVRMKLVEEGALWRPTKALYGFRKSPRLWGNHRDATMRKMVIKTGGKTYKMSQLISEQNLWKVFESEDGDEEEEDQQKEIAGLLMVYVDDICAVGRPTTTARRHGEDHQAGVEHIGPRMDRRGAQQVLRHGNLQKEGQG